MNKIVFFITLSLLPSLWADAPVEIGGQNIQNLAEEVRALQKFVYKRFGGDPAYQDAGVTPPEDPSQTMLLEKIETLNKRFSELTSKTEELEHHIQVLKTTAQKTQEELQNKVVHFEKQLSETQEKLKQSEDSAYQEKLIKMTAEELMLHIETSGKIIPEDRLEKALRLFVTKFPAHDRIASVYKELVYLTYKKEAYKETALYAGEFYKKSPKAPEAPEILLMMAFALGKLEKTKEACMTLSKIQTDYPEVSEDFKERLATARASFSCPA